MPSGSFYLLCNPFLPCLSVSIFLVGSPWSSSSVPTSHAVCHPGSFAQGQYFKCSRAPQSLALGQACLLCFRPQWGLSIEWITRLQTQDVQMVLILFPCKSLLLQTPSVRESNGVRKQELSQTPSCHSSPMKDRLSSPREAVVSVLSSLPLVPSP